MNKNDKIVKALNLNFLTKAHENKWVALSSDKKKVLSSADNLKSLLSNIGSHKDFSVMKVLPFDLNYAPRT